MIIETERVTSLNRSMEDKAYDLLGDMLTERTTAALLMEIEEEAQGDTAGTDAFFEGPDGKNLRLIEVYTRRQKTKTFFTKTLPRAGQIAAIIIAVIALCGGVAMAASDTFRVQVMRLLLEPTDEYVRLSLVEDEQASFDVPAEWTGRNYPSYIPEHLSLRGISALPGMPAAEYMDTATDKITLRFSELSGGVINIDNEGAVVNQVAINGHDAQLMKKDSIISLYWSDGQSYFLVTAIGMDEEMTMKIGKSVRRID